MNDALLKQIANEQMPIYTALKGFVNSINYINIGVISKVHDENYVNVNLYYKDNTGKKVVIQAVRLLHIGTTKCKLRITPAVGDNVLLLCPKDFIETLEYNRTPEKCESSFLPYGDINMCGILIREEAEDNVKTTVTINENGAISVSTKGDISVSTEGNASLNAKGNITAECEGDLSVEAKGNATVKSTNTKLTGGIVEIGGSVTPTGQGALCGMPFCAFSGALQTGKQTQGA